MKNGAMFKTATKKNMLWHLASFFCNFRTCCLSGIRVKDREELERRIDLFIKSVNEDPVIYHWTYKMDEIEVQYYRLGERPTRAWPF